MIALQFMRPTQPQPSPNSSGLIVTVNRRRQPISDKTPSVMVLPGSTLKASLPETPASTGYAWVAEAQGRGASQYLSCSDEFVPADSGPGGRREFTVQIKPGAIAGGPFVMHFELRRPGADPNAQPQAVKDLVIRPVCALPHGVR